MYCPRCGAKNQDESKACKNCGGDLARVNRLVRTNIHSAAGITQAKPSLVPPTGSFKPGARTLPPRPEPTVKPRPSEINDKPEPHREGSTAASQRQRPNREEPPDQPQSNDIRPSEPGHALPKRQPAKTRLIPTHELLRMANAFGIDINYTTLRFWQKRGLIPKPVLGPVSGKRGARGYYDAALLDRFVFIRKTQELGLDLEAIRDELDRLDRHTAQPSTTSLANDYAERVDELHAQQEAEEKKNPFNALCQALGLDPEQIAMIAIRKKDGQLVKILPKKEPDGSSC